MKKFFMMSALFFGMACSTLAADDVTGIKLLGDANDDSVVDIADDTTVLTMIADPTATAPAYATYHKKNADANKDQVIDIADVTTILSIIAGTTE